MTKGPAGVLVQHNSMQFSDDRDQHQHDSDAVFKRAHHTGALFVTGTESGTSKDNHDLHEFIVAAAHRYGFHINAQKFGDWVAVRKDLVDVDTIVDDYLGPFIPGTKGKSAKQGGHSPRGITVVQATHVDPGVGTLAMGCAHYLTQRSIDHGGTGDNTPLQKGIADYGREYGKGGKVALFAADANLHDDRVDVFNGEPFTTVWDELGKYPATHGLNKDRGTTIDIVASYDKDHRVSAESARVLDDSNVKLYTDHFMLEVHFHVAHLKRRG